MHEIEPLIFQNLMGCSELPVSTAWRRIVTATMLALSAFVLVFVGCGTHPSTSCGPSWAKQVRQSYPPHVKPGW